MRTPTLERLIALGRAKVSGHALATRDRIIAAVRVSVARPQRAGVARPDSVVGIDVGCDVWRRSRPRPSDRGTRQPEASNAGSRNCVGSSASVVVAPAARVNMQRPAPRSLGSRGGRSHSQHNIHVFTTNLAKTHGVVWSKVWTRRHCCTRRACRARVRAGADFLTQQ